MKKTKPKSKPTAHTAINIHCPINLIVINGSQNPDVIDIESTRIVKHPQKMEVIGNNEIIDADYTEVIDEQPQKTKFSMKKAVKIATAIAATATGFNELFDFGGNVGKIISSDTFSNTVSHITHIFSNFF